MKLENASQPLVRTKNARLTFLLVSATLATLALVSTLVFRPPSGGISQSAAERIALSQAYSTTPPHVTIAKTGHFRDYSNGNQTVPPDRWVWQVSISGTFPPASCGPAPLSGKKVTCPPDQHSELVVVDYMTGAFLGASIPSPIG